MKLTFSERDGVGNERGVVITLDKPTPKRIKTIAEYYKRIGWEPRGRTRTTLKKLLEVKA